MKSFKGFIIEEGEALADINFIQKELDKKLSPFKKGHTLFSSISTLGGKERPTLILTYFSGTKKTVPHGIIENSKITVRLSVRKENERFVVESFQQSWFKLEDEDKPRKFRKVNAKTKDKAVEAIMRWFNDHKNILKDTKD